MRRSSRKFDYSLDTVLGRLPDPFVMNNGRRVTSVADWEIRRKEITDCAVKIEFGELPPDPERFTVWRIYLSDDAQREVYRIICGTNEWDFAFSLKIYRPAAPCCGLFFPTIVCGDDIPGVISEEIISHIVRRGFILALFSRADIFPDISGIPSASGVLRVYQNIPLSAVGAWAWGYMRAIDAVYQIEGIDLDKILAAGSGNSGKAALLAGALDSRIAITAPNGSGNHGAGCWRYQMREYDEQGVLRASPDIAEMLSHHPDHLGPELAKYSGHEDVLPYDMHFFKALIAPRCLCETESYGYVESNPKGCYQTYLAARRVYDFLDASGKVAAIYREGCEGLRLSDVKAVLRFAERQFNSQPLLAAYRRDVYPDMPRIFDF
ncbi:MAG: hypothetical protein GX897_08135 [Clostridiales bacterium]|nr:hypothetical protein [Clostridiales bacterium]